MPLYNIERVIEHLTFFFAIFFFKLLNINRKFQDKCQPLEVGNETLLKSSTFNPEKSTKFLVHGWLSSGQSPMCLGIKNSYLREQDVNVIVIDWGEIASNMWYWIPADLTKNVGQHSAKLIDFLASSAGAKPQNIHVIGHSLGAHVSGYIGAHVRKGPIARITALDPALPLFGTPFQILSHRGLTNKDAQFVDVIHSCGGVLGFLDSIGHADFYPNGGIPPQPGCGSIGKMMESCSHGRAWEYFAESISSNSFVATSCKNWLTYSTSRENCLGINVPMGDKTPTNIKGDFYLSTTDVQPFAKGVSKL